MTTFRLAHLSDPHLPPPSRLSLRDLASKRLLSQIAWWRKGPRHSPDILAAIVADVQAQAPDHIVVTGDLTNFSTPAEFAAAQAWLQDLAPADALTVSPGNHDALAGRGGPERFALWRPWLGDEDPNLFPNVRVRGPVAVINLCSAIPTALHLAQGELGDAQLQRLEHLLEQFRRQGLYRVVLLHHPPGAAVVASRKSLRDRSRLAQVLARQGAELVLHGHAHRALVGSLPGPAAAITVLGAPSASATGLTHGAPGRWHVVEIEPVAGGWTTRVIARGLTPAGDIQELGRYGLPALRSG